MTPFISGRRRGARCVTAALALGIMLAHAMDAQADDDGVGPASDRPDLAEVVAAAVRGAPRLAAFSAELRAREAHADQAGALPNPDLRTDVEDFGGGRDRQGFEQTQVTVTLGQLVELGGKRGRRRDAAQLDGQLAGWDYEAARLDVVAEATKAFVAVLAAQERLRIGDELVRVAGGSVRAVEAQVAAGGASPVEALQARVALGFAESSRLGTANELDAARTALAATWGAPVAHFRAVRGSLALGMAPPPWERVVASLDANPDVARWVTEVEARRAGLAVERARAIPDVTIGVGGRHFTDNGANAAVFGFTLPLPVFDRNAGAVREAEQRIAKASSARAAATTAAQAALARAWAELKTTWEQARLLQERMVPDAERAFIRAEEAYHQGLFRFLEVLDTQRTLFELRERQLNTLAGHAAAAADVERLCGTAWTVLAGGAE